MKIGLAAAVMLVSSVAGADDASRVVGEVGENRVYVADVEKPKIVDQEFDREGGTPPRVTVLLRGSIVDETACPFERLAIEKTAIQFSAWEESWELAFKPITLGDVSLTSGACRASMTYRDFEARLTLRPRPVDERIRSRVFRYRIRTGGRARHFALVLDRDRGWSLEVERDEVHARRPDR